MGALDKWRLTELYPVTCIRQPLDRVQIRQRTGIHSHAYCFTFGARDGPGGIK